MVMKLNRLALAVALSIGALTIGNVQGKAAALVDVPQVSPTQTVPGQMAPQRHMVGRMDWQMGRDGNRCRTRFGRCTHFHKGYYYETAWWTLPLIIGATMSNHHHGDQVHMDWCMSHHHSYNANTDMWYGHGGRQYRCNSGY